MNAENITNPMNQFSERYQDMQQKARERAKDMYNVTDTFVRENPWWMIGAVAATALVVGLILGQTTNRD